MKAGQFREAHVVEVGGMWEAPRFEIREDHVCSKLGGGKPCHHCHSEGELIHTRVDGTTWTEKVWVCPRVAVVWNEGGYNSTGLCCDCLMENVYRLCGVDPGFDAMAREIVQWQRETFPGATVDSIKAHFDREVEEFKSEEDEEKARLEFSDLLILTLGFLRKIGPFSVSKYLKDKMETNHKREWGEPDEQGVVEHVGERTD